MTWGMLDRLLEDGLLSIRGISGTSAGEMSAVVLADGYEGADQKAREAKWRSRLKRQETLNLDQYFCPSLISRDRIRS